MNWSIIDRGAGAFKRKDQPTAGGGHCRWQVAGRSRGGPHVANMCNAVVLGVVRWRSLGVVTVVSSLPPLQLPAWSRSRTVVKLWTRFERRAEIPK